MSSKGNILLRTDKYYSLHVCVHMHTMTLLLLVRSFHERNIVMLSFPFPKSSKLHVTLLFVMYSFQILASPRGQSAI